MERATITAGACPSSSLACPLDITYNACVNKAESYCNAIESCHAFAVRTTPVSHADVNIVWYYGDSNDCPRDNTETSDDLAESPSYNLFLKEYASSDTFCLVLKNEKL